VDVHDHGDHAVLYPSGYLNGPTGRDIEQACADLMQQGQRRLVINFCHIETINTMGIANLVGLLEKVGRREAAVCFCNLLPANRQILNALDISPAVLIFNSEEDAQKHLRSR
jgi:anti-anti-sigma factor